MDLLSKKLSHHFLDAFGDTNIEYLSKISPQGLEHSCVVSSNSSLAEILGIDDAKIHGDAERPCASAK